MEMEREDRVVKDDINSWEKEGSSVNVSLYANQLASDGSYIGKIARKTVGLKSLVAGIIAKNVGINELMIYDAASLLQKEILQNLEAGNAINILNLGVLYPTTQGSIKSSKLSDIPTVSAKFTVSKITNDCAAKLAVDTVLMADTSPIIESVNDYYDEEAERGTVTRGMMAEIVGERLKVGGDGGGIFFAPVDKNGNATNEESEWIQVATGKIKANLPKTLRFYVPSAVKAGKQYRVIVRTAITSGSRTRKTLRSSASEIVEVIESNETGDAVA